MQTNPHFARPAHAAEAVVSHPATRQKHVWRCRIVLLSGWARCDGHCVRHGQDQKCVWRWRQRFRRRRGWLASREDILRTPKRLTTIAEVIRLTRAPIVRLPIGRFVRWRPKGLAASTVLTITGARAQPASLAALQIVSDPASLRSCTMWWGSMSARQRMRWCSTSMKRPNRPDCTQPLSPQPGLPLRRRVRP